MLPGVWGRVIRVRLRYPCINMKTRGTSLFCFRWVRVRADTPKGCEIDLKQEKLNIFKVLRKQRVKSFPPNFNLTYFYLKTDFDGRK